MVLVNSNDFYGLAETVVQYSSRMFINVRSIFDTRYCKLFFLSLYRSLLYSFLHALVKREVFGRVETTKK